MTDTTQGQDTRPSATGSTAAPDVDSLFPKQDVDDLFPHDYKPPAAPADRNISPIHDFIYSRPHAAEGRVLDAFGYGFAQNWGATQQQMTDADEYMRKAGIWDDYSKGQHSIIKAANEAVMRPAVSAFLAAKGAVFGLLPAGQAAVEQIGNEVGLPELGHEVAALPEAFPAGIHQAVGIPHVPEAPRPPVVAPVERVLNAEVARQQQGLVQSTLGKIAEAKELGVIGAGEDGYFGTKPAVEAALGPEATAAKQAGVTAKEWNETLLGQKPEGAAPSPVVQPAPIAATSISSDQLRSGRAKGESDYHLSPAAVEEPQPYHAFTEMARDLPEDVNNRFQVHGLLAGNPDQNLVDLLNKGIDPDREFHSGAPRGGEYGVDSTRTYGAPYLLISDGGKDLRETGVKNVVAVGPAEANLPALKIAFPNVNFMTVPEAENFMKTGEKPAAIATESLPPAALPPIIPQAIVDQERAKLIAAGRPPEEAEAWANVVAAHYQARAERFEGAKGSAEDLYAKEAPEVKSRGKSVEMAQGGELYQFGGKLMRTADPEQYARAETMEREGNNRTEIYYETGLFRGADRVWRQVIDDSQAVLKIYPSELKSSQSVSENGNVVFGKSTWLDDVIDHPELFKAYPDLRNIRVEPLSEGMVSQGIRGQQDGLIIRMNKDLPPQQFRSTLLHETQHVIQDMEGFAPGDNPLNHLPEALGPARRDFETVRQDSEAEIKKSLNLDDNGLGFLKLVVRKEDGDLPENFAIRQVDIDSFATPIFEAHPEIKARLANIVRSEKMLHEADDIAYTKYTRAMGEVEARNVQKRDEKGLGTFTPPWTTEDVPRWLQHNPAAKGQGNELFQADKRRLANFSAGESLRDSPEEAAEAIWQSNNGKLKKALEETARMRMFAERTGYSPDEMSQIESMIREKATQPFVSQAQVDRIAEAASDLKDESGDVSIEDLRAKFPKISDAVLTKALQQIAGNTLEQVKRGKILLREGAKSIITLFSRAANASTIIHETGHQWLEELMRDARDARAPQSLKDDASTILKWFKVDRAEDIKTEHHELFARGFERYMMEGKAPTPQLASVFEKFKAWLGQIYQSVLQLKAPINDQVRGVFDRLITVRPEEEARAPSFADIHEADAEHIPPAQSREGAQTVASERDRIAATHVPEENNERLEGVGNRAGRLPAGGEQPGDHGNAAGAVPEEEGNLPPTGEVGPGGTETAQEGAGTRKAAERLNATTPTPLLRFIAERGGISARDDLISDLRQSIGGQNRFVPGLGQLIREPAALSTAARRAGQSGAMTLDRAREAAIEAGMLPEGSSIRDLLDRMDQELRGHAPPEARPHNDPAEMAHAEHNFVEGVNDAVKEAGGAELTDAERARAIELWRHEGLTDPAEIIERLALEADDTEVGKGAPERAESIPGWDVPAEPTAPAEPRPAPSPSATAAPSQPAEPSGGTARTGGETEAAKPNPVDPNAQMPRPETKLLDKAGNIRIENLNTPEDVSEVIRQTARDNGGFQEVRGPISDAEVMNLADAAGVDASYLDTRKLGEAWTAPQIVALRRLLIQTATGVRDAAVKAAEGGETEIMAYAEAVQRHRMVQERVSSVTAEAGRALRAFQSKFTEGMAEAKQISAIVQDATGKTLFQLQEEAKLTAQLQTAQQVSKAIEEANRTPWQKTRSGILSWFINNLISGPITHAGYSVGNTVTQLFKATIDTTAAAALDAIRGAAPAERVYFGEVGAQLYGMVRGMRDGYSPAVTALRTGVPYMKGDVNGLIGQIEAAHRPQAIPGAIGYVMETPSRAVTAIHTMHYSMNYEAEIARRAYRSAMVDGFEPGTAEFNTKVADFTQRPPAADMQAAHDEAMKMVLMKSAKFGTAQYHLQKAVNSNILAKIVMPFMQVGANILHESFIERTPLGMASQTVRDNLMGKNGPMARSTQAARLGVGIGVSTAVIGLTAEGILTGGGPSDHRQMAIKEMTGWRPYSIKVGESYVPYRKYLGGLGPLIAGTADIYEVGHTLSEEGLTKAAAGSIFGFAEVIADESWMKGLSNFIDAARHWDRDGERYLRNLAADFIPFSIGLQQVTTLADPYRREVRSMLDAARAHIPGLSQGLFPVRDIWGEPIQSHTALGPSQANNDPTTQALLDAQYYPAKIGRKIRGVELTDQQYDDLARISGRMARMRVSAYVNTPGFAMIPKEMRAKTLRDIIDSSRESARGMIMMQNQQIWQQAAQNKIAKLHPAEVHP